MSTPRWIPYSADDPAWPANFIPKGEAEPYYSAERNQRWTGAKDGDMVEINYCKAGIKYHPDPGWYASIRVGTQTVNAEGAHGDNIEAARREALAMYRAQRAYADRHIKG